MDRASGRSAWPAPQASLTRVTAPIASSLAAAGDAGRAVGPFGWAICTCFPWTGWAVTPCGILPGLLTPVS